MSDTNTAILAAIATLNENQNQGFKQVNERLDKLNGRIRKTENDIVKIKTAGSVMSALAVFFGWDTIKLFFSHR